MEQKPQSYKPTDHLANERTFLAWVRTSIGIMAFGFVVVKFSLFVKQIGLVLGTSVKTPAPGYSRYIGVLLVTMGLFCMVLSYIQFRKTDRQLRTGKYVPTNLLTNLLTAVLILISILLIAYLLRGM
ncbi:putative membrane protein [Dyadobacter jejuensis]|uniref:Putative membrane protein n=1 Tax=Dyadobacter jejuensis TaxID=1082580 RepID=A0A316ACL8_9BACT|nr:DUF202 domain-containing protein [Dyadobacter jejuensis]PWJ54998.1 putative membrane protein [Dyadobacter jejuensis]